MPQKLPKVLTQEEQAALLDQFNTRYHTNLRNLCLVRLMLDGGLRVSEGVSVRPEHVSLASGRVTVREGKGAKDRVAHLRDRERLRDLVGDWLERRPDSPWLLPTRHGTKVKTPYVREFVKRKARKAQVAEWEKVSPHTLRHTFATDLLRETGNLELVRRALGHASVETTQIYVHLTDTDLQEAMKGFRRL